MTAPAPWPRQGVYRLEPGRWFVPSRSERGAFRMVTWQRDANGIWFECSCPAGRQRGQMCGRYASPCRHVLLVADAEKADGIPKPTPAPANVSALVD